MKNLKWRETEKKKKKRLDKEALCERLKMAEKARCQFPWPSFWPCKLVPSNASAIYEQLYTTAQKAFFYSLVSFRPNCIKKSQNCYILHKPRSSGTENLK